MDILAPVETYSYHTIKKISDYSMHLYIGGVWRPDREVFIIGATIGLLCLATNRGEVYCSISRSPYPLDPKTNKPVEKAGFLVGLKKNFLFYLQRDQRWVPSGPNDLTRDIWLPSGSGFYVAKDEPIYIKCAAVNKSGRAFAYDIMATLYWVEIFDTMSRGQPLEEARDFVPDEPGVRSEAK